MLSVACDDHFFFSPIHLIHSSVALQAFVGPWPLQFRDLFYTDGRTLWMSDQPVARPLHTHRTTQTQNKRTQKHPCLFSGIRTHDPSIRATKTVHALDRVVTIISACFPLSRCNVDEIKFSIKLTMF
jgi:hypothetical protein